MHQEKIWEYFQNADGVREQAFRARVRHEYLTRYIRSDARTLNIGVGAGTLEEILCRRGISVSSLDPSEATIARLRKEFALGERAQVGYADAIAFPDNHFDCVVMSEVLEHLPDATLLKALEQVRRVLKPGGLFLGTVPADENLLDNRVVCPHCGEVFHRWGHQQRFSEHRLRAVLQEGFATVTVTRHFFGDWRLSNWKGRIGLLLKKSLLRMGVTGSGETLLFRAQRT